MAVQWRGVFPAATTQFHADQSLDIPATLAHLDAMIEAGVHGLIMLGTVGENCSLEYAREARGAEGDRRPRRAAACRCSRAWPNARRRWPAGSRATHERSGVEGLMVLPAMVYKSDPRETMAHFRAVAAATDLPIMVYNNPVSYDVDVTPEMFAELADEPKLVAIKESSENVRRITDLKNVCGDRYILFCGVDDLVLESLLLGATGWVSGLVNAFPAENRLLWDLATAGRWAEARGGLPLVHAAAPPRHPREARPVHQARGAGVRARLRDAFAPPRLPLVGEERERILAHHPPRDRDPAEDSELRHGRRSSDQQDERRWRQDDPPRAGDRHAHRRRADPRRRRGRARPRDRARMAERLARVPRAARRRSARPW